MTKVSCWVQTQLMVYIHMPHAALNVQIRFFQPLMLKTSGSLLSCALACPSSAPSSTAKCVEKLPRTNCAATKGKKKKIQNNQHPQIHFLYKNTGKCVKLCVEAVLQHCFFFFFTAFKSYFTQAESYH